MKDPVWYFLVGAFLLTVWRVIDIIRHHRRKGPLKRGVFIDDTSLSKDATNFLNKLTEDFVKISGEAWIYTDGPERIIWARSGGSKAVDFTGYVDLRNPLPVLEYRAYLSVIVYSFIGSFFIFLPLVLIGYESKKKAIRGFLEEKSREWVEGGVDWDGEENG